MTTVELPLAAVALGAGALLLVGASLHAAWLIRRTRAIPWSRGWLLVIGRAVAGEWPTRERALVHVGHVRAQIRGRPPTPGGEHHG
jgi:hypothetical protein